MKVKFNKQKKMRFVRWVAQYGNKTKACEAVGISYPTFKSHYDKDMKFRDMVDAAYEEYADVLEAEAHRRAVEGVDEPIYQMGQLVGHKKSYSDSLLKMKLTAARPEKYSNKTMITHQGEVQHKVEVQAKEKLIEKFNKIIDIKAEPPKALEVEEANVIEDVLAKARTPQPIPSPQD